MCLTHGMPSLGPPLKSKRTEPRLALYWLLPTQCAAVSTYIHVCGLAQRVCHCWLSRPPPTVTWDTFLTHAACKTKILTTIQQSYNRACR